MRVVILLICAAVLCSCEGPGLPGSPVRLMWESSPKQMEKRRALEAQELAAAIERGKAMGLSADRAAEIWLAQQRSEYALRAQTAQAGRQLGAGVLAAQAGMQGAAAGQWDTYQGLQTQTDLRNTNRQLRNINNTLRQGNARQFGGYGGPSY